MPVTKDRARFQDRNRGPDLDKNDDGGGHCDRGSGMHCDAQRTMVRVGLQRMDVGHLDDREEGQQDKANHRRRHECSWSPAVPLLYALCQQHDPLT